MDSHLVVIGTSAGGLAPLKKLLNKLPDNFQAPILIVMHIPRHIESHLAAVLARHTSLSVLTPSNGQKIESGCVYIAPPNFHMIVKDEKIFLEHGPTINHCRPAIDPLFYSAANCYGASTIGILLSGLLDDGSAGLLAIKRNHGVTIVQDLDEAEYPEMPSNALKNVEIDFCLRATLIAQTITKLVGCSISKQIDITQHLAFEQENQMNQLKRSFTEEDMFKIGHPSLFSCPICQGILWEINDKDLLRFRCQIGHGFGVECLSQSIEEKRENSLWTALRSLEESEYLAQYLKKTAINEKKELQNRKIRIIKQQMNTLRSILK